MSTTQKATTVAKKNANGVQVFNFECEQKVRIVIFNGEPHFVASDVCNVLSHSNSTVAMQMIDEDERFKVDPKLFLGSKSNELIWIVNESGLYSLIMRSNKPVAKKFRKWVTSEVLPSIRKTGSYSKGNFYPGEMQPTTTIVLDCYDAKNNKKQVYLQFDDETWFDIPKGWFERVETMNYLFRQIAEHDKTVVRYETRLFDFNNGKYTPYAIKFPMVEKIAETPVEACEIAIKNFHIAEKNLKEAAKNLSNQ